MQKSATVGIVGNCAVLYLLIGHVDLLVLVSAVYLCQAPRTGTLPVVRGRDGPISMARAPRFRTRGFRGGKRPVAA